MAADLPGLEKSLRALGNLLYGSEAPRFGQGDPKIERTLCDEIQAFVQLDYNASRQVHRLFLRPNMSVADVRRQVELHAGIEVRHAFVTDETGSTLSEETQRRPLTDFSNGCRLTLKFRPSLGQRLDLSGVLVGEMPDEAKVRENERHLYQWGTKLRDDKQVPGQGESEPASNRADATAATAK